MANPLEIAWAGGLFEGEGNISLRPNGRGVSLNMTNTDPEIVHRFQSIVGGKVYGPYHYAYMGESRPCWKWFVSNGVDVLHIGGLLRPWLSTRRLTKLAAVTTYLETHPPRGPNRSRNGQ